MLDIDPPEFAFDRAVEAALLVRSVLDETGLRSGAKTSGSKGVHVYVPLQRRYRWNAVRGAGLELARRVEEGAPKLTTTEIR